MTASNLRNRLPMRIGDSFGSKEEFMVAVMTTPDYAKYSMSSWPTSHPSKTEMRCTLGGSKMHPSNEWCPFFIAASRRQKAGMDEYWCVLRDFSWLSA